MKLSPLIQVDLSGLFFFSYNLLYAYVDAIEACPTESTEELSQFYQNRAAAWESLVDIESSVLLPKSSSVFI